MICLSTKKHKKIKERKIVMVKFLERNNIFSNLTEMSVILHFVPCTGDVRSNFSLNITDKYRKWYITFHNYCGLFKKHEDEILGTFHVYKPFNNDDVIVCSAFVSLGTTYYEKKRIDSNALVKVLKTIEKQVRRYNKIMHKNQTVHVPYSASILEVFDDDGEKRTVKDYLDAIFGNSPVEVQIHRS